MDLNIIVLDDFLDNPNKVRESVLQIDFSKNGSFPGNRSLRADENYQKMVKEKLEKIFNKKLFFPYKYDSFCFQICLENHESWVHLDEAEWAGVLYLTPDAPAESGTALFTKVEEEYFLNTVLGNVYNRMVLYRGDHFPHRSMISGFGDSIETGRLTQVLFFNTYENGEKQLLI
jgi:hypothetical protein